MINDVHNKGEESAKSRFMRTGEDDKKKSIEVVLFEK